MISNKAKALNVLRGSTEDVNNWEDLKNLLMELNFIYKVTQDMTANLMTNEEIDEKIKMLQEGYGNPIPRHVSLIYALGGMPLLGITLETNEDEEPYDLNSENGVYGYVWNLDDDWCSEYGYSFYENNKRVG